MWGITSATSSTLELLSLAHPVIYVYTFICMCIYYATTNNTCRNEALWSYVHINDIYPIIITNTTLWQHWVTWGGYLLWKWRRMGLTPQSTFTIRFGETWRGFPALSGVWYHLMLNIQGKEQVEYYYTLDDIDKILRPNQDSSIRNMDTHNKNYSVVPL